jgi:hypothetical protein
VELSNNQMQKTGSEADCNSVALYQLLIWSVGWHGPCSNHSLDRGEVYLFNYFSVVCGKVSDQSNGTVVSRLAASSLGSFFDFGQAGTLFDMTSFLNAWVQG